VVVDHPVRARKRDEEGEEKEGDLLLILPDRSVPSGR
jgi:hypothetical protein